MIVDGLSLPLPLGKVQALVQRGFLCPADGPSPLAEEPAKRRSAARAERGTFGAGVIAYVVLIAHSSC